MPSTVLTAILVALALIVAAGFIYAYFKAQAGSDLADFQVKSVTAFKLDNERLEGENDDLREKLAKALADLKFSNEIVTSKHEIAMLQQSEDAHHDETIAVLREIRAGDRKSGG